MPISIMSDQANIMGILDKRVSMKFLHLIVILLQHYTSTRSQISQMRFVRVEKICVY